MMSRDAEALAARLLETVPKTMRMIRSEMRRQANGRVSVPQFRVLVHLYQGSATNRDLAERQGVAVATMSREVNLLVRRGWVLRQGDLADRRKVALALSASGRRVFERIRDAVREAMSGRLSRLNGLERSQLDLGLRMLGKLLGPA